MGLSKMLAQPHYFILVYYDYELNDRNNWFMSDEYIWMSARTDMLRRLKSIGS